MTGLPEPDGGRRVVRVSEEGGLAEGAAMSTARGFFFLLDWDPADAVTGDVERTAARDADGGDEEVAGAMGVGRDGERAVFERFDEFGIKSLSVPD